MNKVLTYAVEFVVFMYYSILNVILFLLVSVLFSWMI